MSVVGLPFFAKTVIVLLSFLSPIYEEVSLFHAQKVDDPLDPQSLPSIEEQKEQVFLAVFIALIPVVVAFSFIVFLLYRKRREAYFREVQLQFKLDKAELEMRALRAQVDPHFIFNCLNSIQYFVHRNESHLAESYLVKFSRLIRLVLENSAHAMVPLEEDLKALELYLEMEQLRLNHSFEFSIRHDGIDTGSVYVPPLLIQPFVENSIWHGLAGLGSGGWVKIVLNMEEEILKCFIEDNGRPKAQPQAGQVKTKSMGLDLIRKRLAMLEKLYGKHYTFKINPSAGDKKSPNGTRIELILPHESTMI